MNCSCASERCPHLQYLRTLLETTAKDQVPSCAVSRHTSTSENVTLWQRWKPYVERTIKLAGCVIETVMLLWVALTRGALQLWLGLLDADRSAVALFLFFALSVISSVLRGTTGPVSR
ncbi:uncharacterized protein LOC131282298 [Anopheles ziemanni]|uniref:uncharacterized protein LOC131262638 n=1 Tax=Anopheles coustani TaxID=139045 RepID=UPI002658EC51|nr:uncharacterized protein LOC131262638 [Anopheles coustani]XP_058167696.1 uncharacterized protein LOC131282298 [Anopheles ziemanni]